MLIDNYKFIGIVKGVCGDEPVIVGTRLRPKDIVNYGTVDEILEDFDYLTRDQVDECFEYMRGDHYYETFNSWRINQ